MRPLPRDYKPCVVFIQHVVITNITQMLISSCAITSGTVNEGTDRFWCLMICNFVSYVLSDFQPVGRHLSFGSSAERWSWIHSHRAKAVPFFIRVHPPRHNELGLRRFVKLEFKTWGKIQTSQKSSVYQLVAALHVALYAIVLLMSTACSHTLCLRVCALLSRYFW